MQTLEDAGGEKSGSLYLGLVIAGGKKTPFCFERAKQKTFRKLASWSAWWQGSFPASASLATS